MNEKASGNEKSREDTTTPPEVGSVAVSPTGIPEGEELTLGPGDGERIDPIDRWWDEKNETEREIPRNRKLEGGKKVDSLDSAGASEKPETQEVEPSPETPPSEIFETAPSDAASASDPAVVAETPASESVPEEPVVPAVPPILPTESPAETSSEIFPEPEEKPEAADSGTPTELVSPVAEDSPAPPDQTDASVPAEPDSSPEEGKAQATEVEEISDVAREEEKEPLLAIEGEIADLDELLGIKKAPPAAKSEPEKADQTKTAPPPLPPMAQKEEEPEEEKSEPATETPVDLSLPTVVAMSPRRLSPFQERDDEEEEEGREGKAAVESASGTEMVVKEEAEEKVIDRPAEDTVDYQDIFSAAEPSPTPSATEVAVEAPAGPAGGEEQPPEEPAAESDKKPDLPTSAGVAPKKGEAATKEAKQEAKTRKAEAEVEEEEKEREEKGLGNLILGEPAGAEKASTPVAGAAVAPKKRAGCWTIFATIFFFGVMLVLVAVGVGAYLGWSKFGALKEEALAEAESKLAEQGIYYKYDGWSYAFPRGLVLENLTLFETSQKQNPVVRASNVGVNLDFVGLIRDRSELTAAEISFSDSALTLFESGQEVTTIQDVDGEILANRQQVRIERLGAKLFGLRVNLRGQIDIPERAKADAPAGPASDAGEAPAETEPATLALNLGPLRQIQPFLAIEPEGEAPVLSLDFAMAADAELPSRAEASLNGRNFKWQGVPLTLVNANCVFDPESGLLHFPNVQVGYGSGFAGGSMSYDPAARTLTIEQGQSTIDFVALLPEIDPEYGVKLADVFFVDAPTIRASGVVPLDIPSNATLSIDYEHRDGLIYTAGERELPVSDLRGSLNFSKGVIETKNFAAEVLGGTVAFNGSVRVNEPFTPYSGLIEVSRMPLSRVGSFFGQDEMGMSGDIYFDFRGTTYSQPEQVRGNGTLRIEQAELASFPVIGEVQKLLGQVIPAFGVKGEGSLTGAYLIESGVLITSDLTVRQSGVQLVTNGSLNLASQDVHFTSVARLDPGLAAATGLGDKSITVKGRGPLAQPEVTLTDFPLEFASEKLNAVLGTSPETLGALKSLLGTEEGAAEILGDQLNEAIGEELGSEVRSLLQGLLGGEEPPADTPDPPR